MVIGLLKEKEGETRVSVLPEVAAALIKLKNELWVEAGAGTLAYESDAHYVQAGALVKTRDEILHQADMVLSIRLLSEMDLVKFRKGGVAIGVYQPLFNFMQFEKWAAKGLTAFSLDMLPRTTRAQAMDVLSSQASVAGYKAGTW